MISKILNQLAVPYSFAIYGKTANQLRFSSGKYSRDLLTKHNVSHKIFGNLILKYHQRKCYIRHCNKSSNWYPFTRLQAQKILFRSSNCLINNGLLQATEARPALNQALLQWPHHLPASINQAIIWKTQAPSEMSIELAALDYNTKLQL